MSTVSSASISVAIVDEVRLRAQRLTREISQRKPFETPIWYANLNEAFVAIETDPPDVVLVSPGLASRAEYPMFDALLEMLTVKRIYLVSRYGRRASDFTQTPIRSEQDIKDFVVSLCRFLGLTTEPVTTSDRRPKDRLVVIGSSTGGIEALLTILPHFPKNCPPTLIVQHIKGDFLPSLVRRLDAACPAIVKEAQGHDVAVSGRILVAPGNQAHLVLRPNGRRCALLPEPPETGHRPSVDRLFQSAVPYGDQVVSVLLTGMGRDGADGMRAIRDAGGWTIAQDEATSVVYGMPQAAMSTGAVAEQLPLDRIGPAILKAAARESAAP